jgi:nucleoside-diphosphate-sugar epimerase
LISRQIGRGISLRRVTVIGGAGYLGSVLVPRLLDVGYQVLVMDGLMYGDESIRHLVGRPGFSLVRGDLRDIEAVVAACARADAVIHLGAVVGDPACALDERATLEINRDATATAARVARALGVRRFVFASTCSVYGATDEILTEDSPVAPLSTYARSKAESEDFLLPLATKSFAPTVLRFGTFYGHSFRERFDLVVNLLVAKAVTEGVITVNGGNQWRPFVHVTDGAAAIMRCLAAPEHLVCGRVYNVGTDEQNLRLVDVAEIIHSLVPQAQLLVSPAAGTEANYHVSFDRIHRELGLVAGMTLPEGILEMKQAVERGLVGGYADARYSNHSALLSGRASLSAPVPTATAAAG